MSNYMHRNSEKRLSGIEFYELLQKGEISSPSGSDLKNSNKMFRNTSIRRSASLNYPSTNKPSRNNFAASAAAAAAASASKITYSESIPRSSSSFTNNQTSKRLSQIRYRKPEKTVAHTYTSKIQEERKRKRAQSSPSTASPVENHFHRFSQTFVSKSPLSSSRVDENYDTYEGSSIGAQSAYPYQLDSVENYNITDGSELKQPTSTVILEERQFTTQNSPSNINYDIEHRKEIRNNYQATVPNIGQVNKESLQRIDEKVQEPQQFSRFAHISGEKSNEDLSEERNDEKTRESRLMKAVIEEEKFNKVLKRKKKFKLKDKNVTGVSVAAKAARGEPISSTEYQNEPKLPSSEDDVVPLDINTNNDSRVDETQNKQDIDTNSKNLNVSPEEDENFVKHKKTVSNGISFFKRFGFGKKANKSSKEQGNSNSEKYSRNLFSRKRHSDLNPTLASDLSHPNGFQQNLEKQNIRGDTNEIDNSISGTMQSLKSYPISSAANTNTNNIQNTPSTRNENDNINGASSEYPETPTKVAKYEVFKSTPIKDSNGTGSSVVVSSDRELESLIKQNNKLDKKLNTKDYGGSILTDSDGSYSGNEMTVTEKL